MKYTDYTIEDNDYKKISDMFFALVKDDQTKEKLESILYEGGYKDFGLSTHITNKDNPLIEMQRRISMANLLVQNPKTFDKLVEKNVNIFHGTNGNALPSILKHGINSYDESVDKGIDVVTGEKSTRPKGRNFISFTDVLDVAEGYSTLRSSKDDENLSFEVVIGTTKEEIQKTRRVTINSDISEIGVMNNLPKESIKVLCVPPSKVKYVKKITNNNEIEVLGVEGIKDKFYYVDDMGTIYIDENKYEQIKNNTPKQEKTFKLSELKDLVYNKIFSKKEVNKEEKVK